MIPTNSPWDGVLSAMQDSPEKTEGNVGLCCFPSGFWSCWKYSMGKNDARGAASQLHPFGWSYRRMLALPRVVSVTGTSILTITPVPWGWRRPRCLSSPTDCVGLAPPWFGGHEAAGRSCVKGIPVQSQGQACGKHRAVVYYAPHKRPSLEQCRTQIISLGSR